MSARVRTLRLVVSYDGADFAGWQRQAGLRTVQGELEAVIGRIEGAPVHVAGAGRTDAGVHAAAQVVHFDTEATRADWVRGTNAHLPPAVRALWSTPVPIDFHARYSARARTYRYLLVNAPVAPALLARKAGWYHRPLDVERMAEGAKALIGAHDFSAFRDAQCQAKSPVRDLSMARIERRGDIVDFTFRANAFLHHMVRNMVGALVYVGAGKQQPSWIGELLEQRDRTRSAPTFAPDGLYLAGIEYDTAFSIPEFPKSVLLP